MKLVAVCFCRVEFVVVDCGEDKLCVDLAKDTTLKCEEKLGEIVRLLKSDLQNICVAVRFGVPDYLNSVNLIHEVSEFSIKLGQPLKV